MSIEEDMKAVFDRIERLDNEDFKGMLNEVKNLHMTYPTYYKDFNDRQELRNYITSILIEIADEKVINKLKLVVTEKHLLIDFDPNKLSKDKREELEKVRKEYEDFRKQYKIGEAQ